MRVGQSATDSWQARTGGKRGVHGWQDALHAAAGKGEAQTGAGTYSYSVKGRGMSRCTQPPHNRRGGACTDTYSRSMRTQKERRCGAAVSCSPI